LVASFSVDSKAFQCHIGPELDILLR